MMTRASWLAKNHRNEGSWQWPSNWSKKLILMWIYKQETWDG